MAKVKKLRLKKPIVVTIKLISFLIFIGCCFLIYYNMQIKSLTSLGYSEVASKNILRTMKKDFVIQMGENKTLNAAFESDDYVEDNLDGYSKIEYQNQKNIIKNINKLIKRGYSNNDISNILKHGDDNDVSEFAKRDKIKYLEEFYSIPYAKLKHYDRYLEYSDETGEDEETTVLYVNLGMDKEVYVDPIIIDEFSVTMLVNKYRKLDENFVPDYLTAVPDEYAGNDGIQACKLAIDAFAEMSDAAKREGLGIVINSGYRSYQDQLDIINTYRNLYGENYVKRYVALEGHSEHQTGLAFDIGSTSANVFANSDEYKWMLDNAHKYGFILRFSKKGEIITGFREEPWHYRFVGKKTATYIYENNLTLEEYYAMVLDK